MQEQAVIRSRKVLERYTDWHGKLKVYLEMNRPRAFRWGSWDCCLFACNVVREITGVDLAERWRGTYHNRIGAWRVTNGSLLLFVSKVATENELEKFNTVKDARAGDVILANVSGQETLGVISTLRLAVFVSEAGLTDHCVSTLVDAHAWRIG